LSRKVKKNQLVGVVDDVCGLHAQAPTTPYFSLWSRVEDFQNSLLDQALFKDKTLVKTWFMRGTLHVIPSEDLPVYNKALRGMWLEQHEPTNHAPDWPSMDERKKLIYPKILEALKQRPLTRNELSAKVHQLLQDNSKHYQSFFSAWGGILKETAYQGLTVHAQPCGRESCFARLDKWLPDIDLDTIDEDQAKERLCIKYLHGYGPASLQDFSTWSGLNVTDFKKAIVSVRSQLEEVEIDGVKGRFFMLREDLKTLDKINLDEKAPVSLLPKFDSILLGHKDRTRIIEDVYTKYVFKPKVGDIAATVLVDGKVVGTWRQEKTRRVLAITVTLFEKIGKEDLKEIEEKARELSQFMGFDELEFSTAS
jgi:uncharacterized protein YcaQ